MHWKRVTLKNSFGRIIYHQGGTLIVGNIHTTMPPQGLPYPSTSNTKIKLIESQYVLLMLSNIWFAPLLNFCGPVVYH